MFTGGVDVSNPRSVISKVFFDGIKNLIYFGIAALVIALIMNGLGWRTFGFILACIFVIPIAINVVKYVLLSIPLDIFALLIAIKEKIRGESDVIKKEPLLLLGNIICLIENSVSMV